MKLLHILVAGAALSAPLAAQNKPAGGVDKSTFDTNCKPCDDFWRHVNGTWLDRNPIPGRYPSWGTLPVVTEANRERTRVILEAAASSKAAAGSEERKIGDLFQSCMDTAAIDARGYQPIEPQLKKIAALKDARGLSALLVEFSREGGPGVFGLMAGQDLKNSKEVIANVMAGATSLPDRDYYLRTDDKSKSIREEYVKHIARMLVLVGDSQEKAEAAAKTILDFETSVAQVMMTNVQRRDPNARYHRMDLAGVAQLAPNHDWKALFAALKVSEAAPVNVAEPEVLKKINAMMMEQPVATWQTWLKWRLVSAAAGRLAKPFEDEDFYFGRTVLTGVKEKQPRWQTCSAVVDGSMGDALGKLFVAKHFPPEAKRRMNELVENLRATLRDELTNANWLEAATRKAAVEKLNSFTPKIGYAEQWKDYTPVKIDSKTYFENIRSAGLAAREYQISKIGKPVNRKEFGMTPPTVNAYYSPTMNEIAFPAGILQPPLFDLTADDAANYGAIGAVIGHEMGHGFDDQGSKFDAEGNLKNWWTDQDRATFEKRAGCVITQFDKLEVGDGLHHNGKLVVGEALGDLGGLTLSYRAYKRSLAGKPEQVIDGYTADQRFFIAFARVWASQYRPEAVRLQLNTNPHPLPRFRVIGTLQNMPEFHKAFGCKDGDAMVRPAAEQCKLW